MIRFFLYFFLFLFSLALHAGLDVQWVDDDTIIVHGTGGSNNNTTNDTALGVCTNCLAISPAEMHRIKTTILGTPDLDLGDPGYTVGLLPSLDYFVDQMNQSAISIINTIDSKLNDISQFQHFPASSNLSTVRSSYVSVTNFSSSSSCTQAELIGTFNSSFSSGLNSGTVQGEVVGYANGIYDYANEYVAPSLSSMRLEAQNILDDGENVGESIEAIQTIISGITEESCASCAPTNSNCGSGGVSSDCPCKEQWDALQDYIEHIDDDQHKRYYQLHNISNSVSRIDSNLDKYGRLVSGALVNDATIVVDDGANSWSNVYRTGHSDLYDYNKSNILQRIELLLFGLASPSTLSDSLSDLTPNQLDNNIQEAKDSIDDAKQSALDSKSSLDQDITTLSGKLRSLFNALSFFGSGNLGNFSITDPTTVFDAYDFEITFDKAQDFSGLRDLVRVCFQIFYWASCSVFVFWFWYRLISAISRLSLFVLKFFNDLIT